MTRLTQLRQQGLRVAIINEDKTIHPQPVTVYRDFGASIELSNGLRGGETIVLNPPTSPAGRRQSQNNPGPENRGSGEVAGVERRLQVFRQAAP
jgi:hypothetical protein